MHYTFSGNDGTDLEKTDLLFIEEMLNYPLSYWQQGTGDSAISVHADGSLIFFKMPEGFFIMQHPDYAAPLITTNKKPITRLHDVGGEPFAIPDVCLCNTDTASKIIRHYIETGGGLHPGFSWIDFTALTEE